MPETKATKQESNSLEQKVAKFKLIARDALRMELINPRLTRITTLENRITDINTQINETEFNIKVENYELSKLDTEHPNYEKRKVRKEETIKSLTTNVEETKKRLIELAKEIDEEKTGIAKIESGETKVSQDSLNSLTNELIIKDAKNQVCENCKVC